MSEIDEDLKISKLEISNNLGLTLTAENSRIKHSGEGELNILSNNGDIRINSNNIMIEASNNITLQAMSNNIFINGGFVGNYEILSSNGPASLRKLTTFLNAASSNLTITLNDYDEQPIVGQIKNFVFYTRPNETNYTVTIDVGALLNSPDIILNNPGNTVSLLYTPINAWSIISSRIN